MGKLGKVSEVPTVGAAGELRLVALADLADSPFQPRKSYDEAYLDELAASIRERGLLEPPLVRVAGEGEGYELIVGHRRRRAAERAGLAEIPVLVRDMGDEDVMLAQLVENQQRRDLSPLEEAEALMRLVVRARSEDGSAVDRVAQRLGLSTSQVFARIKLLDLVDEAKAKLLSGDLTPTVAVTLARVPRELQREALDEQLFPPWRSEGLSSRAAERILREHYMLKLARAPWGLDDATLRPDVGACDGCPHRTTRDESLGAAAAAADLCLEPSCYREKQRLHSARVVESAKAAGMRVVEGPKADKMLADDRYVRVDERIPTAHGKLQLFSDVLDAAVSKGVVTPPETLAVDEHGTVIRLLSRDAAEALAHTVVHAGAKERGKAKRASERQRDQEREQQRDQERAEALLDALQARVRKTAKLGPDQWAWVLIQLVAATSYLSQLELAKLGLERDGRGEYHVSGGPLDAQTALSSIVRVLAGSLGDHLDDEDGSPLVTACELWGVTLPEAANVAIEEAPAQVAAPRKAAKKAASKPTTKKAASKTTKKAARKPTTKKAR